MMSTARFKGKFDFESKILLVICLLGLLRSVLSIYNIVTVDNVPLEQIAFSFSLIVIYTITLLIIVWRKYSKGLTTAFSVLTILILSHNWIFRNGLNSESDVNFLILIVVLGVINRGRSLYWIVISAFGVLSTLVYLWVYQQEVLSEFSNGPFNHIIQFQTIAIIATLLMIFLAVEYEKERRDLTTSKSLEMTKVAEIEVENKRLQDQKIDIERINSHLESEILRRMEALTQSNKRISDFLTVSNIEIAPTLKILTEQIEKMEEPVPSNAYMSWLKDSGSKLQHAFEKITINS